MNSPAAILTPIQAAQALTLVKKVKGIGQLRVLLHMISHPWPMTCEELKQQLGISQVITWTHLTKLIELGLVEITGRDHIHCPRGNKSHLYRVKGSRS